MTRNFVRLLAGVAIAATIPAAVQAQSCNVNAVGGGNCNVGFDATLTVPTLAYLEVGDFPTLALTAPDWAAFLAAPAATSTVSQTAVTIRSNSNYTVNLASAAAWTQPVGAGRVLGDITWAIDPTTCPAAGSIAGVVSDAGTDIIGAGTPTNGATNLLCFALSFPGDLSDSRLLPGDYELPITLTITAP